MLKRPNFWPSERNHKEHDTFFVGQKSSPFGQYTIRLMYSGRWKKNKKKQNKHRKTIPLAKLFVPAIEVSSVVTVSRPEKLKAKPETEPTCGCAKLTLEKILE